MKTDRIAVRFLYKLLFFFQSRKNRLPTQMQNFSHLTLRISLCPQIMNERLLE